MLPSSVKQNKLAKKKKKPLGIVKKETSLQVRNIEVVYPL